MEVIGGLLVLVALGAFYFLPAIIGRRKRDATAIFWVNLLGGWTGLGWLIAFIWALTKDAPAPVVMLQQPVAAPPVATRTAVLPPAPSPAPMPTPVARMATVTPVVKSAAVNVTDELERLFQLKEKGAITEEEYIVHKAKLLA